jgi:SNF2 family DNA or RNA helicase
MDADDTRTEEPVIQYNYHLTDNFLENGILQIDSVLRRFVSFLKDYDEIEFVLGDHSVKGVFRKNNSYILALDLKILIQKLGLEVGDMVLLSKFPSRFKTIFIEVPPNKRNALSQLEGLISQNETAQLDVEYPVVTRSGIEERIRSMFSSFDSTSISIDTVKDGLYDFAMTSHLYQKELISLGKAKNLIHYPHQVDTVRRVILQCSGRALLADEVGLGKTIEAGLILKEYVEREEAKSGILVVPASLTNQWHEELHTKFGLYIPVLSHPTELDDTGFGIMSLDTAKSPRYREYFQQRQFDIVIVDEAHKLKNRKTQNYQFVKKLSTKFLLLLTATPIQNDLVELFNLAYLIAPGALGTLQSFRKQYIHPLNKRIPLDADSLKKKLSTFMIRNNRSSTRLKLPPRRVVFQRVVLEDLERVIYDKLTEFVREWYYNLSPRKHVLNQLTLMLFQKLVTSSPMALAESMQNLLSKGELGHDFSLRFEEIISLCGRVEVPAKFKIVQELMENELKGQKVLLFTQFRSTQRHLKEYFERCGTPVLIFNGEMTSTRKDEVIEKFRREDAVLISTDSGAEGRNLQFARYLINFDFPWNPMKVEQRIGRIHRLGQKYESFVMNLCTVDTIEEHIVELLSGKIRLFERIVGELEMILGYLATDLKELEHLDSKIMEIVVKYSSLEKQRLEMEALGNNFSSAAKNYDEVAKSQDYIFGV